MRQQAVLSSIAVSLMLLLAYAGNNDSGTSKRGDEASSADKNHGHQVGPPPSQLTYSEVYEGNDGKTHWRDITVDLKLVEFAPPAAPVAIGGLQSATHTFFISAGANWGRAEYEAGVSHPTPKRQMFVVLSGKGALITTDGDRRSLVPGTVFLLTDVSPSKGHFTVWETPNTSLGIQLE